MSATGYGDDHPWRLVIAGTLRVARKVEARTLPAPVGGLLCGIAHRMSAVLNLIDTGTGISVPVEPTRTIVAHAGWLADLGLQLSEGPMVKGGAAHWLMDDLDRAGLQALGVQA